MAINNLWRHVASRPISWHGVSRPVIWILMACDFLVSYKFRSLYTFWGSLFCTSELQLVHFNTEYSVVRSNVSAARFHYQVRSTHYCQLHSPAYFTKRLFFLNHRSYIFALYVVFILVDCCVALDPPNLNLTQNKAHILPPCQACKSLVGSFKKVSAVLLQKFRNTI